MSGHLKKKKKKKKMSNGKSVEWNLRSVGQTCDGGLSTDQTSHVYLKSLSVSHG